MPHTKISVITVVLNDELGLNKTVKSVIQQTYKNIEFIVIDGDSNDNTINIIKQNKGLINHWLSEPDKGIYDAMNKGIDLASGEWIIFMNAGDTFYNHDILNRVFKSSHYADTHIIYGDTQVIYPNKERISKAGELKVLWKGSQFSHQSVFVLTSFHKNNKFNISNIIGADFELFYNALKEDLNFKYLDIVVSSIASGGLSDTNRINSILSHWHTVGKSLKTNIYYSLKILKEWAKILLKKLIGIQH